MKRFVSLILCIISIFTVSFSTAGCKGVYSHINQDYLFGICNLTSDQLPSIIDSKVDNTWSADKMGALGAKSTRLWIYMGYYVKKVANSNELYLLKGNCDILHDYIDKLKGQGVERFVGCVVNFVNPIEFNCSDAAALPSVYDDYDVYVNFVEMMGEACGMLAQEFPDIQYWEIGNEPDIEHGSWFHKKGYTGSSDNDHKFTADEAAYISADLCWYASQAIKKVNPNNKVILPGLTCSPSSVDFLDWIYKQIKSGYLPTTKEYSDRNPDNYFDILAWHPYPSNVNQFIEYNKNMYQVAINHGDNGKPLFFTEFGFSDFRFGGVPAERGDTDTAGVQNRLARLAIQCFDAIKTDLPFVETVMMFRLSNVAEFYDVGSMENSFGLFYSPNDVDEWASKPKPIAIELYKYFNGQNADLSVLYKHAIQ